MKRTLLTLLMGSLVVSTVPAQAMQTPSRKTVTVVAASAALVGSICWLLWNWRSAPARPTATAATEATAVAVAETAPAQPLTIQQELAAIMAERKAAVDEHAIEGMGQCVLASEDEEVVQHGGDAEQRERDAQLAREAAQLRREQQA